MNFIIDSHIHFDQYRREERIQLANDPSLLNAIAVSMNLASCKKTLKLSKEFPFIKPAFGFHPEQTLPKETELNDLMLWITKHHHNMIAIGEVGLPYYSRKKQPDIYRLDSYLELLEQYIILAKKLDKPIILHSIYEDAQKTIHLLEKHSFNKAHFHWFKGDYKTLEIMKANNYFISFTPDLLYESEIQSIAEFFPLNQIMVETDGPWPFEGPFLHQLTTPSMIHQTIKKLAHIKKEKISVIYKQLLRNTQNFYRL